MSITRPTYRTSADVLRKLATYQWHGHVRPVAALYVPEESCKAGGYSWLYHSSAHWDMTPEAVDAAKPLLSRYKRFVHYVREVRPGWREVSRTSYADNSIEATEEDRNGNRRTRTLVSAHGDLC